MPESPNFRNVSAPGGVLRMAREDGSSCCTGNDPARWCRACKIAYDTLQSRGKFHWREPGEPVPIDVLDHGLLIVNRGAPKARAAAAKPKLVQRTARGSDGRTSAEREADAELVADLRRLGVDKLRAEEPSARAHRANRRPAPAPRPWSLALGRSLDKSRRRSLADGEPPSEPSAQERAEDRADDRAADVLLGIIRSAYPDYPEDSLLGLPRNVLEEWVRDIEDRRDQEDEEIEVAARAARAAAPRPYDRAFAARRTKADREKAETRSAINTIGLSEVGPQGYTRALTRRQAEADIDAGREPLADVELSEYDPTRPPSPYTEALRRREEAA